MKYWTVQKKEVLKTIIAKGMYQPDFSKSDYLLKMPDIGLLYSKILNSFNRHNNMDLPGLIFSFTMTDNEQIYEISNADDFYLLIQNKKEVIKSLWKQLNMNDVVIMELNYDIDFNPIYIDLNDFQYLMPPIIEELPPYSKQDVNRLCSSITQGIVTPSIFPSEIMQAHLPNIKRENIINIYKTFDFI